MLILLEAASVIHHFHIPNAVEFYKMSPAEFILQY
jgi:hypothetical protein